MGRFGFVGPSDTSQSPNADDERCVNWYPERIESQGKSAFTLYPSPGLAVAYLGSVLTAGGPKNCRGILATNQLNPIPNFGRSSRLFTVLGAQFFELDPLSSGAIASPGLAVTNDNGMVSMAVGPTQVLFAAAGDVFVYDMNAHTLVGVAAVNFNSLPVSQVAYCDGFFLALNANSSQWYASALLDATTWPGTSTTKVNVFPGNVVSMVVNQRQAWMLGAENSVVYYNSGNSPFPFDVIQGSLMEQGCSAIFSPAKMDNSIFWLGGDSRGQAMVWRASGYTPQRVSTHALEYAMQGYSQIADAIGYTYQDQGHSFYQLIFPSANGGKGATWVFDAATGLWHEKAFLNSDGTFSAHRSRCHAFVQQTNKHLVGDWNSATIYQMSIPVSNGAAGWTFADDFGNPIQRLRRAPTINLENEWIFHHEMEVDLETGLGPIPPLLDGAGGARDPQIMLRWSDDGGHTWSNQRIIGAGQGGNYKTRAIYRRLGRSRQRVYELSASDPVPWRIVDAYLKATPTYQVEERLSTRLAKSA